MINFSTLCTNYGCPYLSRTHPYHILSPSPFCVLIYPFSNNDISIKEYWVPNCMTVITTLDQNYMVVTLRNFTTTIVTVSFTPSLRTWRYHLLLRFLVFRVSLVVRSYLYNVFCRLIQENIPYLLWRMWFRYLSCDHSPGDRRDSSSRYRHKHSFNYYFQRWHHDWRITVTTIILKLSSPGHHCELVSFVPLILINGCVNLSVVPRIWISLDIVTEYLVLKNPCSLYPSVNFITNLMYWFIIILERSSPNFSSKKNVVFLSENE